MACPQLLLAIRCNCATSALLFMSQNQQVHQLTFQQFRIEHCFKPWFQKVLCIPGRSNHLGNCQDVTHRIACNESACSKTISLKHGNAASEALEGTVRQRRHLFLDQCIPNRQCAMSMFPGRSFCLWPCSRRMF